jgi:hypothetical protein
MSDADDYQDGRRLVHATLTPQEIDVALNRTPSIPWEQRVLTERRLDDGVPSTAADADAAQVLDPAADQDEPEEHEAKVRYWKQKAVWSENAVEYARAVAHVTRLTGRAGTAWEAETLRTTLASVARGERQAHEPAPAKPAAPVAPPPSTMIEIKVRRVVRRDASEHILELIEFPLRVRVGDDGLPTLSDLPADVLPTPPAPPSAPA